MKKIVHVTAGVVVSLATTAWAQAPSDLMPAAPAPSGPAPYIPGVQPPAANPAAQPAPGAAATPGAAPAPGAKPGTPAPAPVPENAGHGSYVYEESPAAPTESVTTTPPSVYVVKPGDTLSSISAQYFGSPGLWPKLWSFNPAITNPHWVFPGDTLHLGAPSAPAPAPPPTTPEEPQPAPTAQPTPTGILLRQTGFVGADELKAAATIIGSPLEKTLLSNTEEAYVEEKKDHPLAVGQRYTIYRKLSEVRHPVTGELVGALVELLGEVTIGEGRQDEIRKGVISGIINPVERGDLVGPLQRVFKIVEPRMNDKDLDAIVLATIRPSEILGSEMIAFVDRGKDDGVQIGNRWEVVRRGDGYQPRLARHPIDDKRFPREVTGELIIIDVRDKTSTGYVVHAQKEVRVGDRLELRRGH